MDISFFGKYDVILFLNVLHHIIDIDKNHAKKILNELFNLSGFMFFDMGSFTEKMKETQWQRTFKKYWKDDEDMWNDLFEDIPRKEKILTYKQRGGIRTLFLLQQ